MTAPAPTTIEELREQHGPRFRWLVLLTVMVGMMASIMSSTIVNVAVPDMSRYFHIGQGRAQWISAAFMAATTLSLLLTPWLLQRFGLRKTYVGANLMLMVGGIVGGLSGNYPVMIAMRVLEGIAAGILTPIPNVVIMREFPREEQGRAIGIFGFGVVLAPALGPVVGGVLVEQFGWRSIFFVVVPFCLVALEMARRYLPVISSFKTTPQPFDWTGLVLATAATLAVLNGLVDLQGEKTAQGALLIAAGVATFAGFAFHQLRAAHPLLQMRLFTHRPFRMGSIVAFIYGIGLFGSTYLLPIYLQAALDYSPSKAGLVLLPAGLALAITMPIAGRMADKLLASRLVSTGMALMIASTALMATVSAATSILVLVVWVILGRIGIGVIMPSLSLGSMRGLGSVQIPQAASMSNFLRQLGGAVGVSLVGILLEWRLAAHGVTLMGEGGDAMRIRAFDETFLLLAAISLPAMAAAWLLEPKKTAATR
ncbi:MAG: DHA2 family efflux MFS transporter permease subunit [Betaproteobacteria bacterium]